MKNANILVYRPTLNGLESQLTNVKDYYDLRNAVGGAIERVAVPFNLDDKDYDVYVHEEFLYSENPVSMLIYYKGEVYTAVQGNFFICRYDEDGEIVKMSEKEINNIKEYIDYKTNVYSMVHKETGQTDIKKLVALSY